MKTLLTTLCILLISSALLQSCTTTVAKDANTISKERLSSNISYQQIISTTSNGSRVGQSVHVFDNMYYAIITTDNKQMSVINLTKDSLEIALLKKQLN